MAQTINVTLKHKRGTEASMPTLKEGQIYLCSDTHKVFKGTSSGENILISDIVALNNLTKVTGTWTPIIYGLTTEGNNTYAKQIGTYLKIGKLIYIEGHIILSVKDTNMSGVLGIKGLPYIPQQDTIFGIWHSIQRANSISAQMQGKIASGRIIFDTQYGYSNLNVNSIEDNTIIDISGYYVID